MILEKISIRGLLVGIGFINTLVLVQFRILLEWSLPPPPSLYHSLTLVQYKVTLDGRTLRTPARNPLYVSDMDIHFLFISSLSASQ
jgi:hypothetical protein